jgi:hypothetical protein
VPFTTTIKASIGAFPEMKAGNDGGSNMRAKPNQHIGGIARLRICHLIWLSIHGHVGLDFAGIRGSWSRSHSAISLASSFQSSNANARYDRVVSPAFHADPSSCMVRISTENSFFIQSR